MKHLAIILLIRNFTNLLLDGTSSDLSQATTAVDSMSNIIDKYGPAIVILAVFLILFLAIIISMMKYMSNMFNQMSNRINDADKDRSELLAKLIDGKITENETKTVNDVANRFTSELVDSLKPITDHVNERNNEKTKENEEHRHLVNMYIDVNVAFKDASNHIILNTTNCSRIAIYLFHNGNRSISGLPFFKMSCVYEWSVTGAYTVRGKTHNDLPLHIYYGLIEELHKDGVFKCGDIDQEVKQGHNFIKDFIEYSENTKSLYAVAINSITDNSFIGFLVAEFSNPKDFETDSEELDRVSHALNEAVSVVKPILSYQNPYTSNI